MGNIMRAIARLLGIKTQSTVQPAQPTLTAGPANQGRTTQPGKVPSVQTTQPVQTEQKAKRSPAQSTTQAASSKQESTTAKRKPTARGKQRQTPASKTRQHAKQAAKPKR